MKEKRRDARILWRIFSKNPVKMTEMERPPTERARVSDLILELGQNAFDPSRSESERAVAESALNGLIEK